MYPCVSRTRYLGCVLGANLVEHLVYDLLLLGAEKFSHCLEVDWALGGLYEYWGGVG